MFVGFVQQESDLVVRVLAKNTSNSPVNLDALPTFRVYGPAGLMPSGTGTCFFADSGFITGASNTTPIVITSPGHQLSTGTRVTLTGVGGNSGANGTFTITQVDANSFSLNLSVGTGPYTSGGTWNTTGLYTLTVSATGALTYGAGNTYCVLVSGAILGISWANLDTFCVG